ncbi:MAG: flagellar hook-basal body complex protein [Pseudomonadota bacterium]
MDNAVYATLGRQTSLMSEMQTVANNLANASTTGYRSEGLIFAEHVNAIDSPAGSLSMGHATAYATSLTQGGLAETGGTYDLAIEGSGFFMLQTPDGQRLTRAGAFSPDADGFLAAPDGALLLDAGAAPLVVPADAQSIDIAADGTVSADGEPLAQVGLFQPVDQTTLRREDGVRFGAGAIEAAEDGRILQGFVERSNVDPVGQVARMIEIQRSYEMGQSFLEREDERIKTVIQTLGRV